MSEDKAERIGEGIGKEVVEVPGDAEPKTEEGMKKGDKKTTSTSLKDTWKQIENFGQTLSEALQGRGNVVMVRVNDETLTHLDMLVEAEVTKSRSESAAYLINEGVNANQGLFDRIKGITEKISALRTQLRQEIDLEAEE
jgi:hypothetical protein